MVKMTYLGIALLCLTIVPGSFSNDDIHKYMSKREVQQVFQTDHDSVPNYEVVKVDFSERPQRKRFLPAGTKMHIRAFGKDINLWLHPKKTILAGEDTPVYYAKYSPNSPNGVNFSRRNGLMKMVGHIFEDPNKLASVVIGKDVAGRNTVNGYIGSRRIAVKSLPLRVAEEYSRRRRSVDDSENLNSTYHVVFETSEKYTDNYPETPVNEIALRQRFSGSPSGIPDTLYPEILVVVEYSMYKAYGGDIYGLLEYILAYWNGVDLKYRSLVAPKVRFHISGIVLAEDPEATPYISKNSLSPDAFNTMKAMPDASKFWYAVREDFPLESYDIPVTITRQNLGVGADAGILGQAWLGYACYRDVGSESTMSATIFKDNGAFSGIHVTAHELGHLLGAPHDVSSAGDCIFKNGFLMSFTPWYTTNSSDFSTCSTDAIDTALKNHKLDCLFNRPAAPKKSLPRLMPGRIKDLEEQCKARGYKKPCQDKYATSSVCVNFYCSNENNECIETGVGALDGTSCEGNNKFCLHMQCVSL